MTKAGLATTVEFPLADPDVAKDPGWYFERLRATCPVARSSAHDGFWLLSRYADVQAAALNPEAFSSAGGVTIPRAPNPPLLCLEQDDPEHRAFRRPLQGWFSPGRIDGLEDTVRAVVTRLLDEVIDDGAADLGEALAGPLPPIIIALLLGLPEADWPWFRERIAALLGRSGAGDTAGAAAVMGELFAYLLDQLEARRREPREDLLTDVAQLTVDGVAVSADQALSFAFLLLIGGHDTSVGAIGGMIHRIAANPDVRDRLRAEPALVPAAVEESLRLEPPLMGLGRTLLRQTTVAGVTMPVAERVMLLFGSANRDGEVFDDPEEFRLDRPHNRHLTFGTGVHRCVGAPLGRLEMRVVLEEILRRMPALRLADAAAVRVHYAFSRTYEALPVVW
jgi:cytochrome P450